MKILIYSDIHGNLPAFEQMLKREQDSEGYICLGDLVNYGPWSNECVDLACSLPNSILLTGNHEEAFIDGVYPGNQDLVKEFFKVTFPYFDRFDSINKFIKEFEIGVYTCKHTISNKNIYPDTNINLDRNYIIGHSHHQFEYSNNGFKLYNAGSVGQNRKYIDIANYLIYETETHSIEMEHLIYDIDILINEMGNRNYPEACINYYLQKKRYR